MDQLQATVLRALLTDNGWQEYRQLVTEEVLHDNLARSIYGHISRMHDQVAGDLSLASLRVDILGTYRQGETRSDELLEVIDAIEETPKIADDAVRSAVQKFVARELSAKAAQHIATHLGAIDFDPSVPAGLMQRALEIGESIDAKVMGLVDSGLPGEVDDRPAVCALGLSRELDCHLAGGAALGELIVLLAPPARGKTSYLCAIGAHQAEAGERVLHVTLEIPARRVARRYDASLTGLLWEEMVDRPSVIRAARARIEQAGGSVTIADRSYTNISPNDIQALVKQARTRGFAPDWKPVDVTTVIVDYLELMVPNSSQSFGRREQRHVYGQLGKDIRAMGVALGVRVITAWQVNRAGMGLDRVNLDNVSECWDIIKHSDTILALNQSDAERENRIMRVAVLKHRSNTQRPEVELHSDLDRNQIRPLVGRKVSTDIQIGPNHG